MDEAPVRMRDVPKDQRGNVLGVRRAIRQGMYPEVEKIDKEDIPITLREDLGMY
jgi:hypothetical protein